MELFIFSQDEQPLTVLSADTGLVEAFYRIEVNSVPTEPFIFTVKASHPIAKYVVEENKVVFKDHEGDWRFMVIKDLKDKTDQEGHQTTAICFPVYIAELNDHVIEERRFIDQIVDVAMNAAVQETRWQAVVEVELGRATTNFYRIYSTEAFEEIINTWGGELKDVVDFDEETNEIKGCYMKLIQRHGTEHGQRFEIGHNTVEIYRRVLSYPKTALYGYGSSLEVEDEDGEHTGGFTRYIDFGDVEWRTSRGDPVNKPLGQKWVGDPEALAAYGYETGDKHRYGIFSNQDYEDPADLLQATWESLQDAKKPEVNYRLSVELFDKKVSLGDTCQAIDRKFARPIEIQARVIAMEYDLMDIEGTMVVEMGQFLDLGDNRLDDLEKEVEGIKNRPPKQIIDEGSYPNIKPGTPVNVEAYGGMEVIQLYWDYASQIYVKHYEVYGSRTEDFIPDTQHLLWRGNTSAFAHTVGTDEVWYYRIRAVNYHGTPSDWSVQVRAATHRVISDDILWGPELAERMRELHRISDIIGEGGVDFDQISQEAKELINQQAKIYTDEEINATRDDLLRDISEISDDLQYIDGQLIDKVNVGDVYTIADIDGMFENTVSITQYETDMDGIVKDLEHHSSLIRQNEREILNRVTETEFNNESDYLRKSIAETRNFAEGIEQTVSSIEIGGRNLVLNSGDLKSTNNNYQGYDLALSSIKELEGETVAVSFDARSLDGDSDIVRVYWRGGNDTSYFENVPLSSKWKRYTVITEITKSVADTVNTQIAFHTGTASGGTRFRGEFKNVQVERGNKATDYYPAFEDTDQRMTQAESRITQLAEDITLKVDVDSIVSEINVNREGIRLSGALIHLNGLSLIDEAIIQNAHIASGAIDRAKLGTAVIGTAQVENGAITNAKIGSLNVDKLYGSRIQGIDIQGARFYSTSGNDWMQIVGGQVHLTQSSGRYVNLSPNGLFGYDPNGNVRFMADQTLVTSSALGTSVSNVYLATFGEARVVNYNDIPGDGAVGSYRYRPLRASFFYGNSLDVNTGTHLYLRTYSDGEVRATNIGTTNVYRNFRASTLFATSIDVNSHISNAAHLYTRPSWDGELRVTAAGSLTSYRPLRASNLYADSISVNNSNDGTNLYVQAAYGGEVRATAIGSTTSYVTFRASNMRASSFDNPAGSVYLRPASSGSAHVTANGTTGNYRPIYASEHLTGSLAEYKQDINLYRDSALELINQTDIYQYRLNADIENGIDRIKIGVVIGEVYRTPNLFLSPDKKAVDSTVMASVAIKGIQELDAKLTDEINWQRIEYQALKNKVTKLEDRIKQLEESAA